MNVPTAFLIQNFSTYLPEGGRISPEGEEGISGNIFKSILEEIVKEKEDCSAVDTSENGYIAFVSIITNPDFLSLLDNIEKLLGKIDGIDEMSKLPLLKSIAFKLTTFIVKGDKEGLFNFLNRLIDVESKSDIKELLKDTSLPESVEYNKDTKLSLIPEDKSLPDSVKVSPKIIVKVSGDKHIISLPSFSSVENKQTAQLIKDALEVFKSAGISRNSEGEEFNFYISSLTSSLKGDDGVKFLKELLDSFSFRDEGSPSGFHLSGKYIDYFPHNSISDVKALDHRVEFLSLIKDLVEKIQIENHNRLWQTQIEFNSPGVGRALVVLNLEGDRLGLNIFVSHADARELLQNMMPQLQHALEEKGVVLESFHVDVNSHLPFGNHNFREAVFQKGRSGVSSYRVPSIEDLAAAGDGNYSASLYVERNRINCFA